MKKENLPEELIEIFDSYLGNERWEKFVDCLTVDKAAVDKLVRTYGVSRSVAKAIEWHIGHEYAERWFNQEVPVLKNYKPIELINRFKDGEICLREILMRMH